MCYPYAAVLRGAQRNKSKLLPVQGRCSFWGPFFPVEFDWLQLAALQATTAEVAGTARCGILDVLPQRCLYSRIENKFGLVVTVRSPIM
jgi:hypothetical protein